MHLSRGSEIKPISVFARERGAALRYFDKRYEKGNMTKRKNRRVHEFLLTRVVAASLFESQENIGISRACECVPGTPGRSRSGMDTRPGNGRCDNLVCTIGVYLNFIGGLAVTRP